jgi:hypothetical protein
MDAGLGSRSDSTRRQDRRSSDLQPTRNLRPALPRGRRRPNHRSRHYRRRHTVREKEEL